MMTGFALIAAGWMGLRSETLGLAQISQSTPTAALIVVQEVLADSTPEEVRGELAKRVQTTLLNKWETEHTVNLLIRDLRDDDIAANGEMAIDMLVMLGDDAQPALISMLTSPDIQQRQYVASVLRKLPTYIPDEAMFRVCIEGLRDDHMTIPNAEESAQYLGAHIEQVEGLLLEAMNSGDMQQRLVCAAIFGRAGWVKQMQAAAPVLLEHLKDNRISNDGAVAEGGLMGFGWAARDLLRAARKSSTDKQQITKIEWILKWLKDVEEDPVVKREPETDYSVPGLNVYLSGN
jgi:hypothetical protein